MFIKLLQLNIYKGKFLDQVIDFVKKNNIDILNFQEVTSGNLSFDNINCFNAIKTRLEVQGNIVVCCRQTGQTDAYLGNATFYKKNFRVLKKEIIWLKNYQEIADFKTRRIQDDPRSALSLLFGKEDKTIQIINTHLAWGPDPKDRKYKLNQAEKLYKYVQGLSIPFILTGDFNVTPDSKIVSWFNTLGRNLTVENQITNTLNPHTHKARELFPQGWAVDYIFIHKSIKVKSFRIVDEIDLSDHFGLLVEFEI